MFAFVSSWKDDHLRTGLLWLTALFILSMVCVRAAHAQYNGLLTDLLDRPVYDKNKKEIGDIEDIVFRRTGQIQSVLISLNGFLGLPDKVIAVQFRKLKATDKNAYIIDYSREQLERQTEFNYDQPLLYVDMNLYPPPAYHRRPIHNPAEPPGSGQSTRKSGAAAGTDQGQPGNSNRPAAPGRQDGPMGMPRLWSNYPWQQAYYPIKFLGSALLGQVMRNQHGWQLADIEDFLIQTRDDRARIAKIILRTGNLFEDDHHLKAVPYRPLGVNEFGVIYPIREQSLEKIPDYR